MGQLFNSRPLTKVFLFLVEPNNLREKKYAQPQKSENRQPFYR